MGRPCGSTLIGTTDPTSSAVPYDEWPFIWEERTLAFTATSNNHVINFLPVDDDTNLAVFDPNGSLRMGIDLISILQGIQLTGIDDVDMSNDGILSPGPFVDQLTIRSPHWFTKGAVFIYSTAGTLVHERAFANAEQQVVSDLSAIRPGSYVVRLVLDGTVK